MSKKESKKKWYKKSRLALLEKRKQQLLNIKGVRYKGLIVKEDGTVINKFGNEVGSTDERGYSYVFINGKKVLKHRLVWEAYMGKIPEGFEIDHITPISDGGTNALSNLRVVTPEQNRNNPRTIEKYKESNKGKGSKNQRMVASMLMTFNNIMKRYHKELKQEKNNRRKFF